MDDNRVRCLSNLFILSSNVLLDKRMIMHEYGRRMADAKRENGNGLSRSKFSWKTWINKITILVYNYRSNVTAYRC